MLSRLVAISVDGVVEVHASGSTYASMCGIDGDDPGTNQAPAALPPNARITCPDCHQLWLAWREFRASDFAPSLKRRTR
jgi:hypothetical protein